MIFFKVSQNINIKIADNSLVSLTKDAKSSNSNEYIYITSYNDYNGVKKIFKKVGINYNTILVDEKKVTSLKNFPIELGVKNKNEFLVQKQKQKNVNFLHNLEEYDINYMFKNETFEDIQKDLKINKKDIRLAIICGVGRNLGQMLCGLSAIRILKQHLLLRYKNVKIDLLIESSENQFYKRDKEFLEKDPNINSVIPLCINVQKFCDDYDYYIDNSLLEENLFFNNLNFIDAYLYKFGIDYKTIIPNLKYNTIDLDFYKPDEEMTNELSILKSKSKVILFHPYSPDLQRSLPKDIAINLLKELVTFSDYTIISTLKIDKFEHDKFVDLSKYSKSIFDFIYIISLSDYIITVDTATYHIGDAFLIPTVVIFDNHELANKRLTYYYSTKPYVLKDTKKDLSLFKFENELLTINKYNKYKTINMKKILKMLEE